MTTTLLGVALFGVMLALLLALVRAWLGPTIFDRVLAVNSAGTMTVLFISLHGFVTGRPDFLDLGLVYAFMNFIGTIAVLKYLQHRDLGASDSEVAP
ncbi:MAG: monovalent cation/H+ antiporter complex subunit F [Myxococcota bacterium]